MNATPLDLRPLLKDGESMPFSEPGLYPAGISFGAIVLNPSTGVFDQAAAYTTIEVLNVLLGQGNDQLVITGTLVPGPDTNADGTPGSVAVHRGLTGVHGGGNARLEVRGSFTATTTTITRTDGVSWTSAGFTQGKTVTLDGVVIGTVASLDGDDLTLDLAVGATLESLFAGTIAVFDRKTDQTRIGGDTITVTGGAGPNSPLVVYGDTSQDGLWYSGDPRVQSFRVFSGKPFPAEIGNGDSRFIFPVANPYVYAGHDVIDASALFADLVGAALPSVGFVAYGGAGDDTIIGSAAPDYLVGGSGDDRISGGRGSDQLYGDNGVNVDVITRELSIPWVNASVRPNRDDLVAGADVLAGDAVGSVAATANAFDDVMFGDYGWVRQDIASATVGLISGTGDSAVYGYVNPVQLQRIETAGRVREIATVRAEAGADDTISGNGGRDRIFGGNGNDTIAGDGQSNVIFGDHGRLLYLEGVPAITTLHLVESISFPQGGVDVITAGSGDDFIFGGAQGDTTNVGYGINAGDGQNVVFGDHGRVTGYDTSVVGYQAATAVANRPIPGPGTDDYQIPVLALVESLSHEAGAEFGGADTISTGTGRDQVFGGADGDTVVAGDGNNIVFGDYGIVDYLINTDDEAPDPASADQLDTTRDIDLVWSIATTQGGNDTITTGAANDIVLGGRGDDTITAGAGANLVFGDNARLTSMADRPGIVPETRHSVHEFAICTLETIGFELAGSDGDDTLYGSPFADILMGGGGDDVIFGDEGDDLIFGDDGLVRCVPGTPYDHDNPNGVCVLLGGSVEFWATNTTALSANGNDDLIFAGAGNDIVLGQQGTDISYGEAGDDIVIGGSNVVGALDTWDVIDGGAGTDLIAGDNAQCCRRPVGDSTDPRMRALSGTVIYGTSLTATAQYPNGTDGHALVTGVAQHDPTGVTQFVITLLDHSDDIEANHSELWGSDYLAGGPGADEIFGQLGDDLIMGDGRVDGLVLATYDPETMTAATHRTQAEGSPNPALLTRSTHLVGAWRDGTEANLNSLFVNPAHLPGAVHTGDGDDYIEGNGGNDTVFGGLGQDDIVGDSSDLYGLTTATLRPAGADLLFGGDGTAIARNDPGAANIGTDGSITTIETGHAADADAIAGDNAQIFRLVGTNGVSPGAYLTFAYDSYAGGLRLIPRAVELLDYTFGGYAYN
ncbi:MAG: calcium-binding protein, partial [Propionicimonas sp.]